MLSVVFFCAATLMTAHAGAAIPDAMTFSAGDSQPSALLSPSPGTLQSRLLAEYAHWEGTRYRFGGHSHQGIDCSALMQELFRGAVNTPLPRTTGELLSTGRYVTRRALQPGDLVFFKTSATTRHVGVYVGNNAFIHASKMKGVTVSSLASTWWQDHYETARRVTAGA